MVDYLHKVLRLFHSVGDIQRANIACFHKKLWPTNIKTKHDFNHNTTRIIPMCFPTDNNNNKPTSQDWLAIMEVLAGKKTTATTPRRGVRFAPLVSCLSNSPLPFEEVQALWHGQDELFAFRAEAKSLARSGVKVRGLEHCTLTRQKQRKMTIKCTLSAQQKGLDVAAVSQKCSEWNSEIAYVQACQDYCEVYQPAMLDRIPKVESIPARFPFTTKKRENTSCAEHVVEEEERCVRRRLV